MMYNSHRRHPNHHTKYLDHISQEPLRYVSTHVLWCQFLQVHCRRFHPMRTLWNRKKPWNCPIYRTNQHLWPYDPVIVCDWSLFYCCCSLFLLLQQQNRSAMQQRHQFCCHCQHQNRTRSCRLEVSRPHRFGSRLREKRVATPCYPKFLAFLGRRNLQCCPEFMVSR